MSDYVLGILAGSGWGVFVGFLLGVSWLKSLINESDDKDKE